MPEIPDMSLAVFSRPAQIVSGDYFDFFQFEDGAPGLVIADAMGHGVSASMIMTSHMVSIADRLTLISTGSTVYKRFVCDELRRTTPARTPNTDSNRVNTIKAM